MYDDLEIVPFYGEFKAAADEIARLKVDYGKFNKLKKIVLNISRKAEMGRQEIWKEFIIHKERRAGNIPEKQLVEALSRYLTELFDRDTVMEENLDLKMCRKLL